MFFPLLHIAGRSMLSLFVYVVLRLYACTLFYKIIEVHEGYLVTGGLLPLHQMYLLQEFLPSVLSLLWPLYPQKVGTHFADKRRLLGRYGSVAD
jgi:hypothetical protein